MKKKNPWTIGKEFVTLKSDSIISLYLKKWKK